MLLVQGPHFKNHWSTVFIPANSSNFLRYRNVYKIKTEKSQEEKIAFISPRNIFHIDLQIFVSLMMELTALIQKDPKQLLPRLECYLLRYLNYKEERAPKLGDTSWVVKAKTQGILAPGEILFINERVEVRIQALSVSKETLSGEKGDSCLFPHYKQRKIIFPVSHLWSVQPLKQYTCPYSYYITKEVSSGTTGVDVLKNSLSYLQYFTYAFRIKFLKTSIKNLTASNLKSAPL